MRRLPVSFVVVALLGAGCRGSDTGAASGPVVVTADTVIPDVDLYRQPVADDPDPAKGAGAAADYIDCTYGIWQGGWSMDLGPPGSASNPDDALPRFLDEGLFSLPAGGFATAGRDEHRMLYTYSVADLPKAAGIVADTTELELDAALLGGVARRRRQPGTYKKHHIGAVQARAPWESRHRMVSASAIGSRICTFTPSRPTPPRAAMSSTVLIVGLSTPFVATGFCGGSQTCPAS